MTGFVYCIQAGDAGPIKIGFAADPRSRCRDLATGHYEPLRLLAAMPGDESDERSLHRRFARHRIRGEWFDPSPEIFAYFAPHRVEYEVPDARTVSSPIGRLIEQAGGRDAVAARTGKTGWAVKKWERNGIPDRHWPVLIEMSGVAPDDLYRANRQAREVAA